MDVVIIGSHKIGKTTVFRAVKEAISSDYKIQFFNEDAQKVISEVDSFFSYMNMQEQILIRQIRSLNWTQKYGFNSVSDRSIIDNLAYMIVGRESPYLYAFPGDIRANIDELEKLSPIVPEVINRIYDYDLVFYIPIEFKLGNPTKEQILYQHTVNDVIKHLLKIYDNKHYTVTGSVEERRDTILDKIKQHMEAI